MPMIDTERPLLSRPPGIRRSTRLFVAGTLALMFFATVSRAEEVPSGRAIVLNGRQFLAAFNFITKQANSYLIDHQ